MTSEETPMHRLALTTLATALFAATAAAQMTPVQGLPCAQGLPCNAPPPQVLQQIYGSGTSASPPGQVIPFVQEKQEYVGGYMASSFAAIAFWRSASGQPGYSYGALRGDNREQAEQYAMTACREAGGQGCVVGLWGANGHFAIARDKQGQYYAGFAGTPGGAKRSVMGSCNSAGAKCKIVETLDSMPYFFRF